MLRTIIVEDELHAQELLSKILQESCPAIELISIASDLNEGIQFINQQQPDLVFFDIELGIHHSFQILDQVIYKDFHVVFTSAHDQYAIKAFKYDALDYLLKPFMPKDVISAVDKAKKACQIESIYKRYGDLSDIKNTNTKRIPIPTRDGVTCVNAGDITRIEADRSYCRVYLKNEKPLFVTRPLGEIENLLPPSVFFRTHTSHLINLDCVKKYIKEDGGYIILDNNVQIPLARRRKSQFLSIL